MSIFLCKQLKLEWYCWFLLFLLRMLYMCYQYSILNEKILKNLMSYCGYFLSFLCNIVYRKFLRYSDTPENCCPQCKIWTMWLFHRVMSPNDADGMANSVDLIRLLLCTVCPGTSVRKLRIITVQHFVCTLACPQFVRCTVSLAFFLTLLWGSGWGLLIRE